MRRLTTYQFLIDTYGTERLKVLSMWSMFEDEDIGFRPNPEDDRGRSVLEQMVHQCVSEDLWFRNILGIDVQSPPLPETESRVGFMNRYREDSRKRLDVLKSKDETWWEDEASFFETKRSRAWVMVRRIAHTSHHRGQQAAMVRMINRPLHSNYGPTAVTGGLMQDKAPTIYAYGSEEELICGEGAGGAKSSLPDRGSKPVTEHA